MGELEPVEPVEIITPQQAARLIGKNAEFIRAGLRQERIPFINFGSAVQEKEGSDWNYNIIKSKFFEYAGITKKGANKNET